MLYEQWRKILALNRNELALIDLTSGERHTFEQLAAAEEKSALGPGQVAFPQGHSAAFFITVLRAWRSARVVCPLEPSQSPPEVPALPVGSAHLKITSGSTGAARLIAFTEEQLAADADNIVATMGLRKEWPNLGMISLAHSYGFSNLVLPLLLHGIPLVLASPPLPEVLRKAAREMKSITLAAVPALWRSWHEAGAIPPNVTLAISAGAPLSVSLEQSIFSEHGLKIHNFYGASECGGIAYDDSASPREDDACAGKPLRNVKLSVASDGCLEVCSAAAGITYVPNSDSVLGDGRFKTSDLVEMKGDMVFLRGRVSDLINVAGRKISPATIERVLLQHPAVDDCVVFGIPSDDSERTEVIGAAVVANNQTKGEVLREFLLQRIPAWQIPREWLFLEALPVNERGKLSRAELRQRLLAALR